MSETIKLSDTARKTQDNAARSGFAAIDTVAKDVLAQTTALGETVADRVKRDNEKATQAVAEAASNAAGAASTAANAGTDAMLTGASTVSDISGTTGDIGFGRGRKMLTLAAQAMDVYADATERSAERIQALVSSYMTLGRGFQKMQHMWLEMLDHSAENATRKPQDLLHCKTLVEVAEVQRDLYVDALNHAFTSSSRLLELAGRTTQEAVRPLQTQHH